MILIPYDNPSEIIKPSKEPLHFPSSLIWSQLSSILGFCFLSISLMRCNHFNTTFLHQLVIKRIAVICFIANKLIRRIGRKAIINCFLDKLYFMGRSTFNVSGDRKTRSVCDGHDLGAFAALCLANSKTPFFAGTKLPSMNASRMSIFPRSYRSSASSKRIFRKTPCFVHFWKRLWHVWYGGYLLGRSFQGAPVLNIHNIPFSTSRGSRGLRPLGSFSGTDFDIMGSIRFHCSFVSSILIVLHNQDVMSSFIFNNFN